VVGVIGAAGTIGRVVCGFLEQWRIPLARRDFRLAGEEGVDARDAADVVRALDGCQVCVNCTDYRLNLEVMDGTLRAGCHYVDLGGLFHTTRRQLELDGRFAEAGLTAILGMGSAPGKTNLLARAAFERLGEAPRTLEIWAATRDPAAADHPFPLPYSARTLLDELRMAPVVVREGRLVEVEPLSGRAERELPELGPVEGILTLHSELATLPAAYPSLEEASFRLSLSPCLVDSLLDLDEADLPEPYAQSPASIAVHLVDAGGVTGATITRGGSARSTAEPAARAAAEIASGALSAPGVHAPESAIPDSEAFLAKLDTEVRWL
jgi:saccharopine dehydrogenase-like NADP-dependent oxidoreductase